VHRDALLLDALQGLRVADVMTTGLVPLVFEPQTPLPDMLERASVMDRQEVFPVLADGKLVGLVSAGALRVGTAQLEDTRWALAADLMQGPVSVVPEDDLRTAAERLLSGGLRALPVLGDDGRLLCLVGESELTGLYLRRAAAAERDAASLHNP
jgi:CBS domain-containing protein